MEPRKDQVGTFWRSQETQLVLDAYSAMLAAEEETDYAVGRWAHSEPDSAYTPIQVSAELALPERPIVDEVGSITLDHAQTNIVIAGVDMMIKAAEAEIADSTVTSGRLHTLGQRILHRRTAEQREAVKARFQYSKDQKDGLIKLRDQTLRALHASINVVNQ